MKTIHRYFVLLIIISILINSCKKYLDAKPDKKLVVPGSLKDLQSLLDTYSAVNYATPDALEIYADDYYLSDADWAGLSYEEDRRQYTWEKDHVFISVYNDWYFGYVPIYRANTVLEKIANIERNSANSLDYDNVKGQALFIRSLYFLDAAYLWSQAYDQTTAANDMGIPLRTSSDFNLPSVRASVQDTYNEILADLKPSIRLLPVTPVHVLRASRPAAYALIARTYLSMRNYSQAALYADSCLQLNSTLIDYNTMDTTLTYPFKEFNKEVIMANTINGSQLTTDNSIAKINESLIASYNNNDLRKTLFFNLNTDGSHGFYGQYSGNSTLFTGIATDEVLLMRSEAYARLGKVTEAMQDLNTLLIKRWKARTFIPLTAANATDALKQILTERRKELLMRGLRWMDIKRLNKEGAGINLSRSLNGKSYTLPANDLRFALPIPEDIISLTRMPQNP